MEIHAVLNYPGIISYLTDQKINFPLDLSFFKVFGQDNFYPTMHLINTIKITLSKHNLMI